MKNLLSVLAFISVFYASNAQETDRVFKTFRVLISIGDAIPSGPGSSQGASFGIEPKYALNDNIQLGLRMEAALMARGIDNSNSASGNVSANGSYTATGDYYFTTNSFRPFVGAGLGYAKTASIAFDVKDANQNDINYSIGAENKFLGMMRAGFDYGHGRLCFEYNYLPKSTYSSFTNNSNITVRNSYLGIKLGVAIGGGRYKK